MYKYNDCFIDSNNYIWWLILTQKNKDGVQTHYIQCRGCAEKNKDYPNGQVKKLENEKYLSDEEKVLIL